MERQSSTEELRVLLGGGMDSAALLPLYLSQRVQVRGVHFDYGQPSSEGERRSAMALGQHYGITVETIDLGWSIAHSGSEYRCRNALLVLTSASILPSGRCRIALGIHSGTPYYDCTGVFLDDMQRLLDGYFGGTTVVEAPFLEFSKRDVVDYCHRASVPVDITFSCERQSSYPCGLCASCEERRMLIG